MILAATGLRREARIIGGDGLEVVAGAGRSQALAARLAEAAPGAEAIISLGVGGALEPGLSPGDWVVGRAVVWAGGEVSTDRAWRQSLLARLPGARDALILGSDAMLLDRAGRDRALSAYGAAVVDMESHIAAAAARRFGLPFAVARIISDAADHELPPAAAVGLGTDGSMTVRPVLAALVRTPGQLPALLRTGWEFGRALQGLRRGRRLLGPRLGRPDVSERALNVR